MKDVKILGRDYELDEQELAEGEYISHVVCVPFADICHFSEDDIATILESEVLDDTSFVFSGISYELVGADEDGNALIRVGGTLDRF